MGFRPWSLIERRSNMTKARLDGLYLMLLGTMVLILLGVVLERTAPAPMLDFRALYYPARCLIQHGDPYNEYEVLRVYQNEGTYRSLDTTKEREMAARYVYLPTAFSFTLPFAMLPWGPAYVIWMALTGGSLVFASFLVWNLGANYAPVISGCLIGFMLANSELFLIKGMCAGIAVSFCVVAVWCFIRERFISIGVLCFAVSLAVKPQDSGLVWLYLLLAGGIYRKRAVQTLLATIALGLPAVLWVWHISPHWIQELHSHVMAFSVRGGLNDPSLTSSGAHGLGMVISLQAVISAFWDDPQIYNPASYLALAPLYLIWAFTTLRSRPSPERAWLAIASIAALSMLPIYHRQYDAKLILLTVPACVMLWAEGGLIGWLALLVNAAGFVLTGDLSCAILLGIINHFYGSATGMSRQLLTAVQVFPAPIILLVTGVFYLWIYVRRYSANVPTRRLREDVEDLRIEARAADGL
jgi:hypothetical protein